MVCTFHCPSASLATLVLHCAFYRLSNIAGFPFLLGVFITDLVRTWVVREQGERKKESGAVLSHFS